MAGRKLDSKDHARGALHWRARLIDRLPSWAKVILLVLGIVWFVYSVGRYGLGTTVLHTIFSP